MANSSPHRIPVTVVADTPLLRAGLERAAAMAGLAVAPPDQGHIMQLRAAEKPGGPERLDVVVGQGSDDAASQEHWTSLPLLGR